MLNHPNAILYFTISINSSKRKPYLIIRDNSVIVRLTFRTKRAVPTGRAFARERRVSVFAHTAPFVLALEFGAGHFLVARVPGEFLSDQTCVCKKQIPTLRAGACKRCNNVMIITIHSGKKQL